MQKVVKMGSITKRVTIHLCLLFSDIIKDTIKPYNAEDSSKFKTIVAFECRGVEPTAFSPRVNDLFETHVYVNGHVIYEINHFEFCK